MIPKLIRGSSFKGAAAYLLHDPNRATDERVDWVEARNLASPCPQTAWRVMAATALDADRLKAEAGVKNTGRKSTQAALHLVLSWHPDEAESLDRAQMLGAAESALVALGADDRQALIIAHNDSPHPHVHVLINRVSPVDGRMLSSSKEKLKLSRWAEAYERERGQIYCEDRVLNNEARDRGDYTRGDKDLPRQIVEADKVLRQAANDNPTLLEQVRAALRERVRELGVQMRSMINRHREEWRAFEAEHLRRMATIRHEAKRRRFKARAKIIEEFRPQWRALHHKQKRDLAEFERREASFLGRIRNSWRALRADRSAFDGDRLQLMTNAFGSLFSAEQRRREHARLQNEEKAELLARQRAAVRMAATTIHGELEFALSASTQRFQAAHSDITARHSQDERTLQLAWRQLSSERRRILAQCSPSTEKTPDFARAFPRARLYARLKARALSSGFGDVAQEQDNEREI